MRFPTASTFLVAIAAGASAETFPISDDRVRGLVASAVTIATYVAWRYSTARDRVADKPRLENINQESQGSSATRWVSLADIAKETSSGIRLIDADVLIDVGDVANIGKIEGGPFIVNFRAVSPESTSTTSSPDR